VIIKRKVAYLRVHLVLDHALLAREALAEQLDRRLVVRGRELGLELGAEEGLPLGDELRADVAPRGGVGGLDRELGVGEVAHLDLRSKRTEGERMSILCPALSTSGRAGVLLGEALTWLSTCALTIGRIVLYL